MKFISKILIKTRINILLLKIGSTNIIALFLLFFKSPYWIGQITKQVEKLNYLQDNQIP